MNKVNRISLTAIIMLTSASMTMAQLKILDDSELRLHTSNPGSYDQPIIVYANNTTSKVFNISFSGNQELTLWGDGDIWANDLQIEDLDADDIEYQTLTQSSDLRLKTEISPLEGNSWRHLYELEARRYFFKSEKEEEKNGESISRHYGFIAQDVKEIFPDLVTKGSDGMLRMRYVEMIPILVSALKNHNREIEELRAQIEQLKNDKMNTGNSKPQNVVSSSSYSYASLEQNKPNPFNEATTINYRIQGNHEKANILVHAPNGQEVLSFDIQNEGEHGSLRIDASKLGAGLYMYTLVIDGNIIDTKKMLLTSE